jgi:hypothetical protein
MEQDQKPVVIVTGVHWSWGNCQRAGSEPFAQALSPKANTRNDKPP